MSSHLKNKQGIKSVIGMGDLCFHRISETSPKDPRVAIVNGLMGRGMLTAASQVKIQGERNSLRERVW